MYIKREDALKLSYYKGEIPTYDNPYPDGREVVNVEDIESIPSANVKEIRYGQVIVHEGHEDEYYEYCSECGTMDIHSGDNFCPNCGVGLNKVFSYKT